MSFILIYNLYYINYITIIILFISPLLVFYTSNQLQFTGILMVLVVVRDKAVYMYMVYITNQSQSQLFYLTE